MAGAHGGEIGRVVSIWRYPVKSMLGEELNATTITERGLLGDRAFALLDVESGKVASAKNPRRWPQLFACRAVYMAPPETGQPLPEVRIALPAGEMLTTDQPDIEAELSAALGRPVRLARTGPAQATAEGYWPDHDWLPQRDEVFEFTLPTGTFFDGASVHLVTTATLERLRAVAPSSRFEVPRFRPNLVIEPNGAEGFVENDWLGRTLMLGQVHLRIDGPCPRCIMTTLPQNDLPKDPAVLRTAVEQNHGNVGVYASVVRAGAVQRGDQVTLV
jgi:uncharacterized protein